MTLAKTVVKLVLVAAGLLLAGARADAQIDPPGVNRTHYWSYRILDPIGNPQGVGLSDQFFRSPVPNAVDSLLRLINWVYKDNSVVQDTFVHYTWWNLAAKHPANRLTKVTNQFGSYDVQVLNMEFLLTPAWKNYQQPTLPLANHYLCYKAIGPPPPPIPHLLQDEWRYDYQYVDQLEYLCTPCQKIHGGQVYPPVDTLTHLAVYRIYPHSDVFRPLLVDQFLFGPHYVQQSSPEYLFVPSVKYEINTPTKSSTWGKLKTLYR